MSERIVKPRLGLPHIESLDVTKAISLKIPLPRTHTRGHRAPAKVFGVDAFYIDWSRVVSSIPGSPLLIFQGNSGFTLTIDYPVVGSAEAQEHANRWILALYT